MLNFIIILQYVNMLSTADAGTAGQPSSGGLRQAESF
jgi:hypothetical protein